MMVEVVNPLYQPEKVLKKSYYKKVKSTKKGPNATKITLKKVLLQQKR